MVEWGGHHGGWGGGALPPSYIVKKCPVTVAGNDFGHALLIGKNKLTHPSPASRNTEVSPLQACN